MTMPCWGRGPGLIACVVALSVATNRTGNSEPLDACILDPSPTYYVTHRWPTEQPSSTIGCGSSQPIVSAVLGEFRESPDHFHGGVDIAEPAGTQIYSVLQDYIYVDSIDCELEI